MNILVVYQRKGGNANSYYRLIRDLIERFAREYAREMEYYKSDTQVKDTDRETIFLLPLSDISALGLRAWYRFRLPGIAQKVKAGKIIYLNALGSGRISLPQYTIFTDTEFLHSPELSGQQKYLKKYASRQLPASQGIFTYSAHALQALKSLQKDKPFEAAIIRPAANHLFMERSFNEKEIRKDNLTGGSEYFLAKIIQNNEEQFVKLLKAFTIFKNWQKSNMKMVISGMENGLSFQLKRKADSYRYKDDVVILNEEHIDIYPEIISAAYAYVLLTAKDADVQPVVESMQCYTMLMSYGEPSVKEIAGECLAELTDNSHETLGRKMIEAYKNEAMREKLVQLGAGRITEYDFEETKQKMFDLLLS